MNLNSIWSVMEESSGILFRDYGSPAMDKAARELALPSDYFFWAAAIWLFNSEPFDVAAFMRAFPYGLAQGNKVRFASVVQQGYLASDGQGKYHATETGIAAAVRLFDASLESIAPLNPMPQGSLSKLSSLLARISDAAFKTPEPPAHVILKAKRELYRRLGMIAVLEGALAHCLELEGRRDDCYIATWKPHGVEGHTWQVLDQLSPSDALTLDELHDKLCRRGVTRKVHAEDVKELARRGWADDASGKIQITSAGRQVRAEVEAETERLFFAPWSSLNESELAELADLANQLRDGVRTGK